MTDWHCLGHAWVCEVKQCLMHIAHCLVHMFANGIQLQILTCWLDILYVKDMEELLKCASIEFIPFIMYTMCWTRVRWQSTLEKCVECMALSFLVNSNRFNQSWGSVNTYECIEFSFSVVDFCSPRANQIDYHFFLAYYLHLLFGQNPQPLPDSLCCWECSHLNLSIVYLSVECW
jgi:hypothetical protein